jgi:hypothetical protein
VLLIAVAPPVCPCIITISRASRFRTVESCQVPARALRIPRSFSAAAMARCVVAPAASICRTIGSKFPAKASAAVRFAAAPLACAPSRLVRFPSLAPCAFFYARSGQIRLMTRRRQIASSRNV